MLRRDDAGKVATMLDMSGALVPLGAAYYPVGDVQKTKSYAFLLLKDFTLLAFSAAIEPFRIANQLSQKPLYRWCVVSEDGRPHAEAYDRVASKASRCSWR